MVTRGISNITAVATLTLMFILMFFSAWNETAIMDELPHIPAGYSYLTQQDFRLNPEHPPLLKDLAAIPLLPLDINFPDDHSSWTDDLNGQWIFGSVFLYESGNDADRIIRLARVPVMILTILFGWLMFRWARGKYGDKVGLMALLLFTTSPTIIAHGRYVTTDLAAAFGFFIGIVAFVKFLEHDAIRDHRAKYLISTGIIFGVAQLFKFSLFLLVPFYFLLGTIWVFVYHYAHTKTLSSIKDKLLHLFKEELKIIGKIILIGLIGVAVIWIFYAFHVWNEPLEKQLADTETLLETYGRRSLVDMTVWMAGNSFFRPLGQYLLGLLMVVQRAVGGNTSYFLGEISREAWWYYFPVAYFLKEQLTLHLLTLLVFILSIKNIMKSSEKSLIAVVEWMRDNFALTASIVFILVYSTSSITSNLNIGVRHMLPIFPFVYLLVSRGIIKWVKTFSISDPQNAFEWIHAIYERYIASAPKYIFVGIFIFSMVVNAVFIFPYYLSYYNIAGGGILNGYKHIVDSNYDWGQDLRRLKVFAEENNIDRINLDFFGGGSPLYYLGDKFEPWWSSRGKPAPGEWFAISASFLQGAHATPIGDITIDPEDSYEWLRDKTPTARAGTSIFIYRF